MTVDVIKLLEYLQETIESASSIPLTGKVTINKKESLEVIDRVINCLPDEFKKAKWICVKNTLRCLCFNTIELGVFIGIVS